MGDILHELDLFRQFMASWRVPNIVYHISRQGPPNAKFIEDPFEAFEQWKFIKNWQPDWRWEETTIDKLKLIP